MLLRTYSADNKNGGKGFLKVLCMKIFVKFKSRYIFICSRSRLSLKLKAVTSFILILSKINKSV